MSPIAYSVRFSKLLLCPFSSNLLHTLVPSAHRYLHFKSPSSGFNRSSSIKGGESRQSGMTTTLFPKRRTSQKVLEKSNKVYLFSQLLVTTQHFKLSSSKSSFSGPAHPLQGSAHTVPGYHPQSKTIWEGLAKVLSLWPYVKFTYCLKHFKKFILEVNLHDYKQIFYLV